MHSCKRVTKTEWSWVGIWIAIALAVSSLPYCVGYALETPELRFSGFVYNVQDINTYLDKMQQGVRGEWLYHISYTSESHRGTLFFAFHLALGHLSRLFCLPIELVYHLARLVCGAFLLVVVYRFAAAFTQRRLVRQITLLLTMLSGGLGWLILLLAGYKGLSLVPLDFVTPEGFAFLSLYALPHIALAQSFLLLAFLGVVDALETDRLTPAFRSGFWALGATLTIPFYAGVFWIVIGAYCLGLSVWMRRWSWKMLWRMMPALLVPLPYTAYSVWVFTVDPVYRAWMAQNQARSPHVVNYVAAYGMVGGLALIGWLKARRCLRRRLRYCQWLFPSLWVLAAPFLVYLPFVSQRRLVAGVQVPLSLLAARGLIGLARRFRSPLRWWVLASTIAFMGLTPLVLLGANSLALSNYPDLLFHRRSELDALDWLSVHTGPQETILCAFETGNYVPARAGNRVFLGRGSETVRSEEKKEMVARFFEVTTDDGWRRSLLAEYGIAYVLVGPRERGLGEYDPGAAAFLREVYLNRDYRIYRVTLP